MKMDSGIATTMVLYGAIFFLAGWGWGQWWNERALRKEQGELVKGRMNVSMPVNPEDAAETMKLLAALVEEAERNRKAKTANAKSEPTSAALSREVGSTDGL